jgi:hypothetical protein
MDKKNNERSVVFLPDGTISSIYYDDVFDRDGNLIGKMVVNRVTDVEFDNENQQWVAKLIKTGEIIVTGKKREDVLNEEARIVQEMLFQGEDIKPYETKN